MPSDVVDLVLEMPVSGPCRVQNSPANRVPSHGTAAFGSAHAIDLVPVDERGRSAPATWRTVFTTEPLGRFIGFGTPVLAPVTGEVVAVLDGEPDHDARRSPLVGVPYLLTQARRARLGAPGLAGNHVVIAVMPGGPFVLLAHLRRSSPVVAEGQRVAAGQVVGECGSSGNSTEPHVHLQAGDRLDWEHAEGVPFTLRLDDGARIPRNGEVVASAQAPRTRSR